MEKSTHKKILVGLISIALFISACSSSYELEFDNAFDSSSDSYDYDVITSLNTYVDLGNAGYDATSALSDDIYYYETDLDNYEALSASGLGPEFTCNFYIYDKDYIFDAVMNPSSDLTTEEQSLLAEKASAMTSSLSTMETDCFALETYVTNEEYLTDDFAKSDELLTSIYDEYNNYLTIHNDMLDYIESLFDEYETFEVDESNPESVALGNMRETLDLADDALDIVEDMYTTGDMSHGQEASDLYSQIDELNTSYSSYSSNLEDYYAALYYDYYFTDLDEYYLPELKQAIVDANSGNYDNLSWSYSYLLDYYNYLIDDYNYFLEEAGN